MQTKKIMTGFLLLILLYTVINRPLFSLNEFRSLQMKQEIIQRVFDTNRELGYSCVVNRCSIKESKGMVTVKVNWMAQEGRIWIDRSIFFTVSEVYYGANIRQKLVIYKPILFQKYITNNPIRWNDDGSTGRLEFQTPKFVFVEVPGGGGSGHNVSIDDPPSLREIAMLMRNITVARVDYRPLLEYDPNAETSMQSNKRIAFIWDQYEDLMLALRKIRGMGFEVAGTFGQSYGAYLCAVTEAKSPGFQGRLFLGAGIYDVFSASEYWFLWFGLYLPGEDLLNEWSPGNTYFDGDKVFIACPAFDTCIFPTHSSWLKDKWPKATLKEYPSDHSFAGVEEELLADVIKWILMEML